MSQSILEPPTDCEENQVSTDEHKSLLTWLERGKTHDTVAVLLRRDPESQKKMRSLARGSAAFPYWMQEACRSAADQLRDLWCEMVGSNSYWARIHCYPSIGVCTLRGPTNLLRRFFELPRLSESDSPVTGYIYTDFFATAESAVEVDGNSATNVQPKSIADRRLVLKSFGEECYESGRAGGHVSRVKQIAYSDSLVAALYGARIDMGRFGNASPDDDPFEELCSFKNEFGYLHKLKLGDAASWGENPGKGQTVCIVDSGVDESHPALQTQVNHYLRLDVNGYEKEAYACTDNGCHGTKVAACCSARPLDLAQFGRHGRVRIGVAPGAKLVVISALVGDFQHESGTLDQLFAALQHAVGLKDRFGHGVVNISLEPNGRLISYVRTRIDQLLEDLKQSGLVPILAAGNRGSDSCPLGTAGYYVGALDPNGQPSESNGPAYQLLAPGSLICAQPPLPRLGNRLFGRHSGSSLAAAVVTGAVAIVAGAKRISTTEAIQRIIGTARNRVLSIDDALR